MILTYSPLFLPDDQLLLDLEPLGLLPPVVRGQMPRLVAVAGDQSTVKGRVVFLNLGSELGLGRIMLFRLCPDTGYPVFSPDIRFLILPLSGRIVRWIVCFF